MNNIHTIFNSWYLPTLESRVNLEKGGNGVYAMQPVQQGTLLAMFGGSVLSRVQLEAVPEDLKSLSIQVDEDLFLVTAVPGPGDHFNHSCNPNAGLWGQIGLVAMRDIDPDEEITFDYAMSDSVPYDEFDCMCGTAECRGRITGNDWQNPTLWERYRGYFSLYLQRRIDMITMQSSLKEYADMKRHKV